MTKLNIQTQMTKSTKQQMIISLEGSLRGSQRWISDRSWNEWLNKDRAQTEY